MHAVFTLDTVRNRGRQALLALSLIGGVAVFAVTVHSHYPIHEWLFWRYASYWLLSVAFTLACAGAGDAVVRRLLPGIGAAERVVSALAAGLFVFFLGMFAGGLLGLYGPAFFVAWPLAMMGSGGRRSVHFYRRSAARGWQLVRKSGLSPISALATVFGLLGLGILYFGILTPDNVAYDSHWYHLPIAEHYVAQGAVRPFVEGWYFGAYPHLTSFVYAWAFLLPGGRLFDHVELALHLELCIFIWTLFGVFVLTRWLLAPARKAIASRGRLFPAGSWAAVFLFPGIFLYDSSLHSGADHVAAFWAPPAMLALGRVLQRPSVRHGAWLAVPLGGAVLTKYTAVSMLAAATVVAVVGCTWQLLKRIQRRETARGHPVATLLAAAATGAVLTSPHWLKNWLWYGDPFYPYLHEWLTLRPWTADSAHLFEEVFKGQQLWVPRGSTAEQLTDTLGVLATFSFAPHDWPAFHGSVPVFGSLFTLLLIPLLFVKGTKRLWLTALCVHIGIVVWFWMSHQDRYLQVLVPWMAGVVAGTLALAWTTGTASRVAASSLVALQIAWGSDVPFLPTHAMLETTPPKASVDLLSTGHRKDVAARWSVKGSFADMGKHLSDGDKVLMHDNHVHLGLGAMSVSDWGPWQGGISYGRLPSPGAFYDQMRAYGVTHFHFRRDSRGHDSLAGDLLFFTFVNRYAENKKPANGGFLVEMPERRPPDVDWLDWKAAVLVCPGTYEPGVYRVGDLRVPVANGGPHPPPLEALVPGDTNRAVTKESQFVVIEPRCHKRHGMRGSFDQVAKRKDVQLWIAKRLPEG